MTFVVFTFFVWVIVLTMFTARYEGALAAGTINKNDKIYNACLKV